MTAPRAQKKKPDPVPLPDATPLEEAVDWLHDHLGFPATSREELEDRRTQRPHWDR
jgi:hypothetical protein